MDNPDLRRDVVYVQDESERLGRPLTEEEYPASLRDTFMLPSGWTPEFRQEVMTSTIKDASQEMSLWDRNYALLIRYKFREGHCNVPHSYKEDGINLGMWVSK